MLTSDLGDAFARLAVVEVFRFAGAVVFFRAVDFAAAGFFVAVVLEVALEVVFAVACLEPVRDLDAELPPVAFFAFAFVPADAFAEVFRVPVEAVLRDAVVDFFAVDLAFVEGAFRAPVVDFFAVDFAPPPVVFFFADDAAVFFAGDFFEAAFIVVDFLVVVFFAAGLAFDFDAVLFAVVFFGEAFEVVFFLVVAMRSSRVLKVTNRV